MPDIRRYEMLIRVKEFGVAHADLFPAESVGSSLFASVATRVDQATQFGATQARRGVARDRVSAKAATREALRAWLLKISRAAYAMAAVTPALDGKFVVPRSHSDQRLLLAARGFLQDATPLRGPFVAHHLPAAFLDDLTAAIAAFEGAIQAQADAREARAAARVGIAEALAAGVSTARRLDAILTNVLERQPETLAEWHSARHVSRVSLPYPSRKRPAEPVAVSTLVMKAA